MPIRYEYFVVREDLYNPEDGYGEPTYVDEEGTKFWYENEELIKSEKIVDRKYFITYRVVDPAV